MDMNIKVGDRVEYYSYGGLLCEMIVERIEATPTGRFKFLIGGNRSIIANAVHRVVERVDG